MKRRAKNKIPKCFEMHTWIVHQQPIAHRYYERIHGGTCVKHPVDMMQAAFAHLTHNLEILTLYHHALRYNPRRQPSLHRTEEQTPMCQVDPPFCIMILEVLFGASDVE